MVALLLPIDYLEALLLNQGRVSYTSVIPMADIAVTLDGQLIETGKYSLNNFPVGDHTLIFSHPAYEERVYELSIDSGDIVKLDATLTPKPLTVIALIIDVLLFLLGIVLVPVSVVYVYRRWREKGRDIDMPKIIIPEFQPPKDIRSYLAGALIDEKVDMRDITSAIIDLAYRGHILIEEKDKGSNYKLTKRESGDALNPFEVELLDAVFGSKTIVETKNIGPTFVIKYPKLVKNVYQELVEKGYFTTDPNTTRNKYIGSGVGILSLAIIVFVGLLIAGLFIIGVPGPLTIALALFVLGISLLIASTHMPAKTKEGSMVLAHLLGFKMYMYTAERFRLQDLKPEDFERYLSYAVAFQVEKPWAEKVKDIYKGNPEWYVGSGNMYDAMFLTSITNSFSTAMVSKVYSYSSSSGSRGGGWSGGGGSFGGFSGGGGGGGSSGAF
jgi:uncharacterized membrane protein YgcG